MRMPLRCSKLRLKTCHYYEDPQTIGCGRRAYRSGEIKFALRFLLPQKTKLLVTLQVRHLTIGTLQHEATQFALRLIVTLLSQIN